MLVISRKTDQSIVINGEIEITVVGISKDGVRLGINAPRNVQVHRREVFEAIKAANIAAAIPVAVQDAAALLRANLAAPKPESAPEAGAETHRSPRNLIVKPQVKKPENR